MVLFNFKIRETNYIFIFIWVNREKINLGDTKIIKIKYSLYF